MASQDAATAVAVIELVEQLLESDQSNRIPQYGDVQVYSRALVGFADARDSLFESFRCPAMIGDRYRTPIDWLPNASSVISVFLHFSEFVRAANRALNEPSEEWAWARTAGDNFERRVKQAIAELLTSRGHTAVVPSLESEYLVVDRRANWSEKHAAYACGLGSFGLASWIITKYGCAGRLCSVVSDCRIAPTPRASQPLHPYCAECRVCIDRCPGSAILAAGLDRGVCAEYVDRVVRPHFAKRIPKEGCAKCQIAVPCETGDPSNRFHDSKTRD